MDRPLFGLRRLVPLAALSTLAAMCLCVFFPARASMDDEIVNSLGMRFVPIPGGAFQMGSSDDERYRRDDEAMHPVRLTRPFYLSVYEVTQRQYERVMGKNPSYFAVGAGGQARVRPKEAPLHPVEGVSWHEAVEFCAKVSALDAEKARRFSYRLPTEAEWEWACRSGTTAPLYFGDNVASHDANFNGVAPLGKGRHGPFLKSTCVVGGYKPNAFGLHDMHGNVAEWCNDWYDPEYYRKSPRVDPTGPSRGDRKVVRGGGWANTARECRSAARNHLPPDASSYNVGFRVVLVENR